MQAIRRRPKVKSTQYLLASFLSLGLACTMAHAAEGMWPYEDIHYDRIKADIGVTPASEIIDHLRLASLTRAGGCSYSFVSPNGLILTNQHCVQECLRSASQEGEDLIHNGFSAATIEAERRCPGTRMSQLIKIADVTDIVRKQVDGNSDDAYFSKLAAQRNLLKSSCAAEPNSDCALVSRYGGLKFFLYHYKTYHDLRIAFAPEQSISFFGEENVNHVFDVAFLRAYDDTGRPVDTSGHYLKFSSLPPAEGDVVLVSGNPYYTRRYMLEPETSDERDVILGHFLYNAELRGLLSQLRLSDPAASLTSDPLLFLINITYANNARMFDNLIHRTPADAAARTASLNKSVESIPDLKKQLDHVIFSANFLRAGWPTTYLRYMLLEQENYSFLSEYFQLARDIVRSAQESVLPDSDRLPEYVSFRLPHVLSRISTDRTINKQLETTLMFFSLKRLADLGEGTGLAKVRDQALRGSTPASAAVALVSATQVGNRAFREELYRGGVAAVQASQDPMIAFVRDVIDPPARQARRNYSDYLAVKAEYQRSYYDVLAKTSFPVAYPDADGTLRLSYGKIKGIAAPSMPALTKIKEVFDLDGSRWNYNLPQTWKAAKGTLDLNTTLSFFADSDTIGGNSGSAAVNTRGEVVGLVWGGTEHGSVYYTYNANDRSMVISAIAIKSVLRDVYKMDRIAHEISEESQSTRNSLLLCPSRKVSASAAEGRDGIGALRAWAPPVRSLSARPHRA